MLASIEDVNNIVCGGLCSKQGKSATYLYFAALLFEVRALPVCVLCCIGR
jgi:hypothetical protein